MDTGSAINYYTKYLSLNEDNFLVYYNFKSGINNIISSVSGGKELYSGELISGNDFFRVSGSGFFDGNSYVKINNASGLNSNNWTAFIIYEKTGIDDGAILSCYQGSAPNISGFMVGATHTNKLFFEFYENDETIVKTTTEVYGTKNGVAISRGGNSISFYYFNFNTKEIESESFSIQGPFLQNSNDWYLGTRAFCPDYYIGNNFRGYIDEFIYFNQTINPSNVKKLFSGFCQDWVPAHYETYLSCSGEPTGYLYENVVAFSGMTGFSVFSGGMIVDPCLGAEILYSVMELSGATLGLRAIPVYNTGECVPIRFFVPDQFFTKSGYIDSFGMDEITYLKNIGESGFSELYYISDNHNKNNYNYSSNYNLNQTFSLDRYYTNDQLNVFVDGSGMFPSGYFISGDNPLTQKIILSGDYAVINNYLEFTGRFSGINNVSYDVVSGQRNYVMVSSGSYNDNVLTGFSAGDDLIFLNGIKITSGFDYLISGTNIVLLQTGLKSISGIIFTLPKEFCQRETGIFTTVSTQDIYARTTSQLWLNGLRQKYDYDYVENSKYDLISGSGLFFENNMSILYNNTNDYWE